MTHFADSISARDGHACWRDGFREEVVAHCNLMATNIIQTTVNVGLDLFTKLIILITHPNFVYIITSQGNIDST